MTTLFDSGRRVKPRRPVRVFGQGVPTSDRRTPFTAADLVWAAANLNANARDYAVNGPSDAALEHAAGCALALSRLEAGWRPF